MIPHKPSFIAVVVIMAGASWSLADDAGLVHRWRFTADRHKDAVITPLVGKLPAMIVGPVVFGAAKPFGLQLDGNSKKKHRIDVTDDLAQADLPTKAITVEAWVRVDKVQEWGGIAGAFQDNGPFERGWLLGYNHAQFYFAVATQGSKKLTYLKSRTQFLPGFWYHVVGAYDGKEQRLFVDGELQATSQEQSGDIAYPPRAFFTLGAYRDDDEHYTLQGGLEEVSIYSNALTTTEVVQRFRERKDSFPDIIPHRPIVRDWPTYLRDNTRRGLSDGSLTLPLHLAWDYKSRRPPQPAWPEEAKHDYYNNKYNMPERVVFDRAFQVVGVGNRVYFGSSAEDKFVCLDADTGRAIWSFITEGPVRLAPTIADDTILFGSDDGHAYCLAATTGKLIWKRRLAPEDRRIPGNERIISAWPVRTDVLVERDKAFVCAGVFPSQGVYQFTLDRQTGDVLNQQALKVTAQGYLERKFGKLMVGTGRNPAGEFVAELQESGRELGKEVSSISKDYSFAFIGAGPVRIGGGDGKIAAFNLDDGKLLWSAKVEGKVLSLALVGGRLLASTDLGNIYCFQAEATSKPQTVRPDSRLPVYPSETIKRQYETACDAILKHASAGPGYCLVLGSGDGWLAYELAGRTAWQIIVVEPDEAKALRVRRLFDDAGLTGRVSIHHHTLDSLPYADYFFNVIVGEALVQGQPLPAKRDEVLRVLRPHGGIGVFDLAKNDVVRRGPLKGEGEWTHLYGDLGNSACSGDERVGGEHQILWFGKPGPRTMIDRHHRTVSPLYKAGRLFVPGEDRVTAVDAYNGTILWDQVVPESRRVAVFRDSGYLALADNALYVAAADKCLALDPQSGKQLRSFALPEIDAKQKWEWAYVATVGDLLLGSAVKHGSVRREQSRALTQTETHWDFVPAVGSDALFAYNRATGKLRWTYRARTGLVVNPTLTVGANRIYFVESGNSATLTAPTGRARLANFLGSGSTITALDLDTGNVVWQQPGQELALLQHNVFGSFAQDRYVLVGSRNSGKDKKKDALLYDVHVVDGKSGALVWKQTQRQPEPIGGEHGEQERHPAIVAGKLYCEPKAYDLLTGKKTVWNWPWAQKSRRGCGTLSASASCFFFRDENVGAFDLEAGAVKNLTSETRPGCWINVLPVGGLILCPEASSGCSCNFSVQTSLALVPKR